MSNTIDTEEIKRLINVIHDSFERLKVLKNLSKDELSMLDKELSNHYHKIEGSQIDYTYDSHILIMTLRDILWNRREAKIKHTLLESFVTALDSNMIKTKKRVNEIINKHEEVKDEIKKRAK